MSDEQKGLTSEETQRLSSGNLQERAIGHLLNNSERTAQEISEIKTDISEIKQSNIKSINKSDNLEIRTHRIEKNVMEMKANYENSAVKKLAEFIENGKRFILTGKKLWLFAGALIALISGITIAVLYIKDIL